MPSDRDPNQILIGAGQAGADSVGLNSLLFNAAAAGQKPTASEVDVITPPTMDGENVQEIIDEYWSLIPDRPNFIDEFGGAQFNGKNPVGWTFPTLTEANYYDSGIIPTVVTSSPTFDVDLTLFPADRGVLAVKVDGTHVSALNLEAIFTEGSLFSDTVPSRILAQNDYTAGSDAAGTVGGLPQNINLVSRVPMEYDYSDSAYPGVLYPYEEYRDDFYTFQIARATITVDLSSFANQGVPIEIVHYATEADFNAMGGTIYASVTLANVFNSSNSSDTFFYDDGTGDPLSFTSSSYAPAAGTVTPTSPTSLSGVTYYGSSDDHTLNFEAEGLWDNAFLTEGAEFRLWQQNSDADVLDIPYTSYDTNGTEPDGDPAIYSNTFGLLSDGIGEAQPSVTVLDTEGNSLTSAFTSLKYLWAPNGSSFSTTEELFRSELTRYSAETTSLSDSILPDGSTSTWLSSDSIEDKAELQMGGVATTGDHVLAPGGALKYPDTDYTTGYAPSSGQRNYSALSGNRAFLRSLDLQESALTGTLSIVGDPISADLLTDIQYDGSPSFEGHSQGIKVEIAPSGFGSEWQNVGREYGDGNGAALSWTSPSPNELEIEFKLFQYPQLQNGFYPVAIRITIFDGAPSQQIEFYKVQMTPTL